MPGTRNVNPNPDPNPNELSVNRTAVEVGDVLGRRPRG